MGSASRVEPGNRSLGRALAALGVVAVAGLLLAACGSGGSRGGRLAGTPTDTFQKALTAKEAGRCDRAIPMFESLARIGGGWELAQYHLAECLVSEGRAESGTQASDYYRQAVRWLMPAANANESNAQVLLAELFLEGAGVPRDPVEAAKWYLLSRKSAIEGINDDRKPVGDRLEGLLSAAQWEDARARTESWSPTYQPFDQAAARDRARAEREQQEEERFNPPQTGRGRR